MNLLDGNSPEIGNPLETMMFFDVFCRTVLLERPLEPKFWHVCSPGSSEAIDKTVDFLLESMQRKFLVYVQLRPFTSCKYLENHIYRMYNPIEISSYN